MKFHSFLIKYGEIGIKGKNRYIFEDALVRQIRYALQGADGEFLVHKCHGRVYVDCEGEYDYDGAVEALQHVFGIVGICPVVRVPVAELEQLKKDVVSYVDQVYEDKNLTFKVEARRANKRYPVNSMEINCAVGEAVLEAFPETKVDVHDPDVRLNVEIREEFIRAIKNGNRTELMKAVLRSDSILQATWEKDGRKVAEIVNEIHNEDTASVFYNNEQALRSVIKMAYLSSMDYYSKMEEIPAGKGVADILFFPKAGSQKPALIVELKWNQSEQKALNQILDKKYTSVLKGYQGDILLVGINYNEKSKEHGCVIQEMK